MSEHYIRHAFLMDCGEPCYLFYDNYEGEHSVSEFEEFPGVRFKYRFDAPEVETLKKTGYAIGAEWILEEVSGSDESNHDRFDQK